MTEFMKFVLSFLSKHWFTEHTTAIRIVLKEITVEPSELVRLFF